MAIPASPVSGTGQVRIQLFTRSPELELSGIGPILVSTKLSRVNLSRLINKLLEKEKPVPLEILINGIFLRSSLDQFLTESGVSAESTLSVEYTPALLPPVYRASYEHDNWIGSVDILSPSHASDSTSIRSPRILTGSYDGLLRVWNTSGECLATSTLSSEVAPAQLIYSTRFISPSRIISCGFGVPTRVWTYQESTVNDTTEGRLTPEFDLHGHREETNSVAVNPETERILTASNDKNVVLFSLSSSPSDQPAMPEEFTPPSLSTSSSSTKRQKTSSTRPPPIPRYGALSTLSGHTAGVKAVIFHPHDPTIAYSASKDRTLKTWDLETSKVVTSRRISQHEQLWCLTALPARRLLAIGTIGEYISIVDPRIHSGGNAFRQATVMVLHGFKNAVTSVAADPRNDFAVAGGSHDGTVRVFDIRGAGRMDADAGVPKMREVYKIPRKTNPRCDRVVGAEGVKVFGIAWDAEVGLCSASEDKMLQIDSVGE